MSDGVCILTIPRHNPVNAFTMGGIARDAGLSVDQFKKLLESNAIHRLKPTANSAALIIIGSARRLKRNARCLYGRMLSKPSSNKQLWIGLARVGQSKINGTLWNADEAYVNVISLAAGKSNFVLRSKKL